MVKRANVEFTHFVIDKSGLIFASARDADNKIYNFIVNQSGDVLEQINSHFESINGEWEQYIKRRLDDYQGLVSTHRVEQIEPN